MIDGDTLPDRHDCDSWRSVAALLAIIAVMIIADQVLWPSFAKRMLQKPRQGEAKKTDIPYVQGMLSVDDEVAIAAQLLPPELAYHPVAMNMSAFISLNPDVVDGKLVWREPPQALLDMLNDPAKRTITVRSCADMIERNSGIIDAKSGQPGTVYYIHIKRKLDGNRFLLDRVGYTDGMCAHTNEYIATRTETGWTFTATGVISIS